MTIEETFRALYETIGDARDAAAALALFADDEDVYFAGSEVGEVARGRTELEAMLRWLTTLDETLHFEWSHARRAQRGRRRLGRGRRDAQRRAVPRARRPRPTRRALALAHPPRVGATVSLDDFARVPLTFGPSPVHRLERLSEHLGGGVEIWAKRED